MPYEHNAILDTPPDDAIIWRYQSLPKFLSMLTSQTLWFSRVDLLGDPWEGALARPMVELFRRGAGDDPRRREVADRFLRAFRSWRNTTAVNCWHAKDHESAAMWDLYGEAENTIAIQTTIGRFKEAVAASEPGIFLGRIRYINYESDQMPWNNAFQPVIHKRTSFEHEAEVRAMILMRLLHEVEWTEDGPVQKGVAVPVSLVPLIESIKICPGAPSWYVDTVGETIATLHPGLPTPTQSTLYEPYIL